MISKRLVILENLQTALRTIKVVNGFLTNIGNNVVYWQDTDFEYGLSVLNFKDTIEDISQDNYPYQKTLTVEICVIEQNVEENLLLISSKILKDLEKTIDRFQIDSGKANIINTEKIFETKGKKALKIKVILKITYRDFLE
jgi:hypothetical protein